MNLNPQVRVLLAAALLSGEYPQARGQLMTEQGYCCLGVLTDLYVKTQGLGSWAEAGLNPSSHYAEAPVREWAGLDWATMKDLAALNDSGARFPEIARHLCEGGKS